MVKDSWRGRPIDRIALRSFMEDGCHRHAGIDAA